MPAKKKDRTKSKKTFSIKLPTKNAVVKRGKEIGNTPVITAEELRAKLKVKHIEARKKLAKNAPDVDKYLKDRGIDPGKLRDHSAKAIGTGMVAGALLLNTPVASALPTPDEVRQHIDLTKQEQPQIPHRLVLVKVLKDLLPERTRPLIRIEEKLLEQVLKETTGIPARATLEGEHLNTTYGKIGAEQHLRRYPGDVLDNHGTGDTIAEGIAPGLGAWGYFAPTKAKLTPELEETERWYAVVQTLYLHDWNTRQPYLRDWYKHRKVLMVNTENGNAVVAAIADSGPAAWTGKHYGGSPEVMDYLGGPRYKKGPVLTFFVDDPENKIPLGPVEYDI